MMARRRSTVWRIPAKMDGKRRGDSRKLIWENIDKMARGKRDEKGEEADTKWSKKENKSGRPKGGAQRVSGEEGKRSSCSVLICRSLQPALLRRGADMR
jgi:hypothetical protein